VTRAPDVVIVCYRSSDVVGGLLEDLRRHEPMARVTVVDNATPEGPPVVPPGYGRVVVASSNGGFGAGCNLGAGQHPQSDLIVFLNPDVRLQGASLTTLAGAVRRQADVGIATGPVCDPNGARIPSAWGPASAMRAFLYGTSWRLTHLRANAWRLRSRALRESAVSTRGDDLVVTGHVLGGAMLVRRQCFEQLGGFDEGFFMFWEDADLCRRAIDAGWLVKVLPCAPFIHTEGTSSQGVTSDERWEWYVAGADRYARRHLSTWQRRRLLLALRLGRSLRWGQGT
jgi:N-acetylglucosaminyl-diphospho-decaprenol L-rhamnosyltransferase